MSTYASHIPKFKAPRFKNRAKLIKGRYDSDFITNHSKHIQQINLVLFGLGTVGSSVLQTILENRELHSSLFHHRYNIKAIFDSSGFVYNGSDTGEYNSSINDATLINILNWKNQNKNPLRIFRDIGFYYNDFERMKPQLLAGNNTILIDTSFESSQLESIFLDHSKKGGGLVMANKKQLSSQQSVFDHLTAPERLPRIGFEATVGGALPFISTLQNLLVSGDNVYRIEGMLSGSIGYMLTKWQYMRNSNLDYEKSRGLFADIILNAHKHGFTEPDPRDDLLGIDNARKAVILGRSLGMDCNLDDVLQNTPSLLPMDKDKCLKMDQEEFINLLEDIDENELHSYLLKTCVNYNNNNNSQQKTQKAPLNLKYITCIDTENETIKIELRNMINDDDIEYNHRLFKHIYGPKNILQYTTDQHTSNHPMIIQGNVCNIKNSANAIISDVHKVAIAINHSY